MIGAGIEVERLKSSCENKGLTNIKFYPPVPMKKIGAYLRNADALKKDPLFEITIPSKTQAYMQVGKPILMGVRGDAADVINKARAGIAFDPENAKDLASVIIDFSQKDKDLLDDFGINTKKYYLKHLSLAVGCG